MSPAISRTHLRSALLKPVLTVLITSAAMTVAGHACAQDSTAESQSMLGDRFNVNFGLGMAVLPRYMGADEYRSQVVPMLTVQRGIFFADTTRGLGLQWQSDSGFGASAALNYDFGRTEKNSTNRPGSNELRGMSTVKGATVGDFMVSQQLMPWLSVSAEAELRVAGEQRGNRYRLGFEGIAYHSQSDTVTLDIDAHAGDGRYNQTYFGVSPIQSQRTGFSRFNADSGIYAYSAALAWQHTFDAHWSTVVSVGVTHYTDQTRGSPLVETDAEGSGLIALNYAF
ncbi:Outer membrane protein V [Pseudomonas syringae pv. syringae HS191]|uniref:MipA/OmpV family protein n=1 Tax=Pseudomonas syringae TaxID=317 RepID=UPI000624E97F|nr:MipA/OmpV family protein [Pseudomonas syringae]AKF51022.1 Outer membrane protein V [Pseudomonas syringae pv. syringae HS191]RML65998.1 MltA-interacting MipA [Pseudomonas syringae pv. syringae]RMU59312.1 MltA-interacting MipA protein [Pseudomonas syringae pv. syringae]